MKRRELLKATFSLGGMAVLGKFGQLSARSGSERFIRNPRGNFGRQTSKTYGKRLQELRPHLLELMEKLSESTGTPGYVLGILHGDEVLELAYGTANISTNAPMLPETGFLLGSVSKILTTTLLMRFIERGLIALDAPVTRYLPEFKLADPQAVERIKVCNLVNHTSGIDADGWAPHYGRGDDAIARYVRDLAQFGLVHPVNEKFSYCNPGFIIAGRILEVVAGETFDHLLKSEIFETVGMTNSSTSGDEAILRSTAVGHFMDFRTGKPRATRLFMLPYSMAPAGSTPIVTVGDMLRFAFVHMNDGVAQDGTRVLSEPSTKAMRTLTVEAKTANTYDIGLSWMMPQYGSQRLLWHGGGSFGGLSHFLVSPEAKFAFAAFGNGRGAGAMHDVFSRFLLEKYLGLPSPPLLEPTIGKLKFKHYLGTYEHLMQRSHIERSARELVLRNEFWFTSKKQRKMYEEYSGAISQIPPVPLVPLTQQLFLPQGGTPEMMRGIWSRTRTYAFLDLNSDGHFNYLHNYFRISRRKS